MIHPSISSETRALAERLVARESSSTDIAPEDRSVTCRVCEKLRRPLTNLMGVAGFSSLLRRSLALAKREAPALNGVQVVDGGSLAGLEGEAAEASAVLIAHLIELLAVFIGETLTFRLLHDIWPDLLASEMNSGERNIYEPTQ